MSNVSAAKSRENPAQLECIVSVHDVMPHTRMAVVRCIEALERAGITDVYLLVVPGCEWQDRDFDWLHQLVASGYQLAGHGWQHKICRIGGLYHRLHSTLVSRDVAEHLALDALGIEQLMTNCRRWFSQQGLPEPSLYVPPAWAMGSIKRSALYRTGFRYIEYQTGLFDVAGEVWNTTPLLGYEADTLLRRHVLSAWNRFNTSLIAGRRIGRLSIHPNDLELALGPELRRCLEHVTARKLEDLFVDNFQGQRHRICR